MQREAVGHVLDAETKSLLDELLGYPDVPSDWRTRGSQAATATMPVIPLGFVKDGCVLNYFSMVMSVGTPQTVAAQELRVECMFPADANTEATHAAVFTMGRS